MCALEENLNGTDSLSNSVFSIIDHSLYDVREEDRLLFDEKISSFLPDKIFDAHAHWYDSNHLQTDIHELDHPKVGFQIMKSSLDLWMGSKDHNGLYFPFPVKDLDCKKANEFLGKELIHRPLSRGLMMIRPDDEPDLVELQIQEKNFCGFKVYHVFANRPDTFQANQGEFLPEWAWEIANRHGLWITMHMVLKKALSEPTNLNYIREHCIKYPDAHLILAHVGLKPVLAKNP